MNLTTLLFIFLGWFWPRSFGSLGWPRAILPSPLGTWTITSIPRFSLLLSFVFRLFAVPGARSRFRRTLIAFSLFLFLLWAPAIAFRLRLVRDFLNLLLGRLLEGLTQQLLAVMLDLIGDAPAGLDALGAALQLVLVTHHFHFDVSEKKFKCILLWVILFTLVNIFSSTYFFTSSLFFLVCK